MRNLFLFASFMTITLYMFAQGGTINTKKIDEPLKGPFNMLTQGVIDGVVVKEDLPLRLKAEYEHVRLSDYVWSKRVFSRIDAREKINHPIFYPYDYFNQAEEIWQPPINSLEIDKKDWVKHQERYSLWTIILRHIMLGDLTVFQVTNPDFPTIEDGYQLKYPIYSSMQTSEQPFFDDMKYRVKISRMISFGSPGPGWTYTNRFQEQAPYAFDDVLETFEAWDKRNTSPLIHPTYDTEDKDKLKIAYYRAIETFKLKEKEGNFKKGEENSKVLRKDDEVQFISSQSISAYNIKEDWFFDKERSVLDKRIIAIAPVGRYKPAVEDEDDEELQSWEESTVQIDRFKNFVAINAKGAQIAGEDDGAIGLYEGPVFEREMFWLYFPELRNVIVNYFVYNEKSDAQWMSFDDLFWKRRFSGMIYKSSDKFDRDLNDYRYGVDALYEAEKIKEDIRKWEHDVWNF